MTRWLCLELLNEELVCLKVVFKQILLCADTVILPNDQNLSFGDGDETHPIYLPNENCDIKTTKPHGFSISAKNNLYKFCYHTFKLISCTDK